MIKQQRFRLLQYSYQPLGGQFQYNMLVEPSWWGGGDDGVEGERRVRPQVLLYKGSTLV